MAKSLIPPDSKFPMTEDQWEDYQDQRDSQIEQEQMDRVGGHTSGPTNEPEKRMELDSMADSEFNTKGADPAAPETQHRPDKTVFRETVDSQNEPNRNADLSW